MSNTKRTVCGSGFREAFATPSGSQTSHKKLPCTPLHNSEGQGARESAVQADKVPPPPLPIRLSIKKGSGFSMQMPCDKEFVVVVVSSVRSGRRLKKWLALLLKLTFNRSSL